MCTCVHSRGYSFDEGRVFGFDPTYPCPRDRRFSIEYGEGKCVIGRLSVLKAMGDSSICHPLRRH
jgi:hypothetical protein